MTINDLKKYKLPDSAGVYFFKAGKKVLYIGKATSLRDRVKSYFNKDIARSRGALIVKMLKEVNAVDFIKTDSVLEALILEANLIKKHQPKYNTKEKDDKSFNYLVITKENFPRVLIARGKELEGFGLKPRQKRGSPEHIALQYVLGPFPHGTIFKDAMKIVRKIFPFRDKCKVGQGKPCFNKQIGLCPGVCSGEISKREYARTIANIKLFFEGKKQSLIKKLEREMKVYAKKQEFEKAGKIKKTIFSLNHIQDIALVKKNMGNSIQGPSLDGIRIEGYDVAHTSGTNMIGVMIVVEDGEVKKADYRKFNIKTVDKSDDIAALKEMLSRRLNHTEWQLPHIIVVDGGVAQKNVAEKVLKEYGFKISVVAVVKDERHKPKNILGDKVLIKKYEKEILLANAKAHRFALASHRKLRSKI